MFSLPDLTSLIAVADHGSIRSAACALGRTQPAVTQAIKRLEEAAGFPVLDRSSYRARLTERGESFIKQARQLLWHAQRLQRYSSLLAEDIEPRLRIEVDGAIPSARWASLVDDLRKTFPETVIEIECGEGSSTLRRFMRGDADLALLFDFAVLPQTLALEALPVGQVDFCTVVRSDRAHLLEDEGALFPQLLVADYDGGGLEFGAVEGRHFWRVDNHRMQSEAIMAGLGWGTTPLFMVRDGIENGELRAQACFGLAQEISPAISLYRRRGALTGKVSKYIWQRCALSWKQQELVRFGDGTRSQSIGGSALSKLTAAERPSER